MSKTDSILRFEDSIETAEAGLMASTAASSMIPLGEGTVEVHKEGEEGFLTVLLITGEVLTAPTDRPDWAAELHLAQTAERHLWYVQRLGTQWGNDNKQPTVLAYEDLNWLAFRAPEDGELDENNEHLLEGPVGYEVNYDADYRMGKLAEAMGVDLDAEEFVIEGARATLTIALDNTRTEGEMADFLGTQSEAFERVKTGTDGHI